MPLDEEPSNVRITLEGSCYTVRFFKFLIFINIERTLQRFN